MSAIVGAGLDPKRTFVVYVVRCGSCGFAASSLDHDRTKAQMFDHLQHTHGEAA